MRTRSVSLKLSRPWTVMPKAARPFSPRAPCCGPWLPVRRNFIPIHEVVMIETPSPVKDGPKPSADDQLIDTSKMSAGQRAALELTEAAREATQETSFVSGLFMGSFEPPVTFPIQSSEDRDQGDAFLHKLEKILRDLVDPDEIDR